MFNSCYTIWNEESVVAESKVSVIRGFAIKFQALQEDKGGSLEIRYELCEIQQLADWFYRICIVSIIAIEKQFFL